MMISGTAFLVGILFGAGIGFGNKKENITDKQTKDIKGERTILHIDSKDQNEALEALEYAKRCLYDKIIDGEIHTRYFKKHK